MTNKRLLEVGIESKGNIEAVESLLINFSNSDIAFIKIPVKLLAVDERYQVEERTNRSVKYLIEKFDKNKLMPITVVPHKEEGLYYIVDGFARVIATQLLNPEEFKSITAMVLLNVPEDPQERLKFEADLYAYQDRDVAKLKPIQRHGAKLILKDESTCVLEKMKNKYGFEYTDKKGNRPNGILGSYAEALKCCKNGEECADYVFSICNKTRFNTLPNGYASYVIRGLSDAWKLYPDFRKETHNIISKKLRGVTPSHLKSFSVTKYPLLDYRTAVSMYIEDLIVDEIGINHARELNETHTKLKAIA